MRKYVWIIVNLHIFGQHFDLNGTQIQDLNCVEWSTNPLEKGVIVSDCYIFLFRGIWWLAKIITKTYKGRPTYDNVNQWELWNSVEIWNGYIPTESEGKWIPAIVYIIKKATHLLHFNAIPPFQICTSKLIKKYIYIYFKMHIWWDICGCTIWLMSEISKYFSEIKYVKYVRHLYIKSKHTFLKWLLSPGEGRNAIYSVQLECKLILINCKWSGYDDSQLCQCLETSLHHGNRLHCLLLHWILFKRKICLAEELLRKRTVMYTKRLVFCIFYRLSSNLAVPIHEAEYIRNTIRKHISSRGKMDWLLINLNNNWDPKYWHFCLVI